MATAFGANNRFASIRSVEGFLNFFGTEIGVWSVDEDGNIGTQGGLVLDGTIRGDYGGNGVVGVPIVIESVSLTGGDGGALTFGANNSAGAGFRYLRVPNA